MARTHIRIKEILRQKNLTQATFADKLGINRISLNQTLKKNNFTLETLEKWADLLEVEVIEFFQEPNIESKEPAHYTCPKCGTPLNIEIKEQE